MPRVDGDESIDEELNWLMDCYGSAIYKFLLVLLSDRDTAMDCAQETFVRAYDNLRRDKPVNVGWLYKVARSRAMNELHHQRRQQPDPKGLENMPTQEPASSPRVSSVRRALEKLAPEDREVLYLFIVDRFKTEEIANMLGIGPGAVRMRLTRARRRFRVAYGGNT